MKAARTFAYCLCLFSLMSSILNQPMARAANTAELTVLERYADELTGCIGFKYYEPENTQRYLNYRAHHPDYTLDAVISYVNIGLDRPFYSTVAVVADPWDSTVLVNKYRQLPADYVPAQLEKISPDFSVGTQKLSHPARIAFEKMSADAKKHGLRLFATSAYRSYKKQANVYASYAVSGDPASSAVQDAIAARPGFSEHQTGLAVDVVWANAALVNTGVYKWYAKNAYKYGFIIRYPLGKEGITGYSPEPWHLRYLGISLAAAVYRSGWTYDEYYAREIDLPAPSPAAAVGIVESEDVTADGTTYRLPACRVLGETYFRLRDIAALLSRTTACFDIAWDGASGRIALTKGVPSTGEPAPAPGADGTALLMTAVKPTLEVVTPAPNAGVFQPDAYATYGANWLRLDDVLPLLGVSPAVSTAGGYVIETDPDAAASPGDTASPNA